MPYKELLTAIAIAMTFYAFLPYIKSIKQGKTKPHVFTWIIWGSTTFVVFLAQLADKGGPGAWPIGLSGSITIYVAYLAYKNKADTTITRVDWVFLITAFAALPAWYITSDPLWAVVILTVVDVIGYGPTFRKAYFLPYEEQLSFYLIMAIRNTIATFALTNYSVTTVLFPAVMATQTYIFIIMVLYRRKQLSQTTDSENV